MASSEHTDAPRQIADPAQSEAHDLLVSRLRDIHMPDAIGDSALSAGAWWVAGIIAVMFVATVLYLWLRRNRRQPNNIARHVLRENFKRWRHDGADAVYLQQSNIVLKRLALTTVDRQAVARLSGDDWVEWLNRESRHPLSEITAHALTHDCYLSNPKTDIALVHQDLLRWLSNYTRTQHA